MKIFVLLFLLNIALLKPIFSQIVTFERVLGTSAISYGFDVLELSTGEFVVTGMITPFSSYVYLAKTANTGEILWQKELGPPGCGARSIIETDNGEFLIAGTITNSDIYILKTNSNGDTLWTKSIGDTLDEFTHKMIKTNDGGYAIIGWTYGDELENSIDAYLLKLDVTCEVEWFKKYGGKQIDRGNDILQLDDGGFLIAGETTSYGQGSYDIYLIRTDSIGDTLWTRVFGGLNTDIGSAVALVPGGNYLITGTAYNPDQSSDDIILIRLTNEGETVWTQFFGGIAYESASSIEMTSDGHYIITGKSTTFGQFQTDLYLLKIDADGNIIWSRIIGSDEMDFGRTVRQTVDSGFILTGHTYQVNGRSHVYLVKTNEEGYLDISSNTNIPAVFSLGQNYPNPFNSITTIQFSVKEHSFITLNVYDIQGNDIHTLMSGKYLPNTYTVDWNSSEYSSGLYLYRLTTNNGSETKKMLLVK